MDTSNKKHLEQVDIAEQALLAAFMAKVDAANEVYNLFDNLYSDILEYDDYLFEIFDKTGDIEGMIKDDYEHDMERAINNYEPWQLLRLIKKHYENN